MPAVISDNALTILKKRYLVNGESVEGMFRRCSLGNEDYYNLMSELLFLPNSPTLFNCGTNSGGTLSACFVFDVDDTLLDGPSSIVETRRKAAAVAKAGGGVGYYFGHIRPKGSEVHSVHRKACGPVSVLRDYHSLRQLITQGGKRDLAQMGVLNCDHPDIREFIHCKDDDPKAIESFNISVSWKDEWLKKVVFEDKDPRPQDRLGKENEETKLWWGQCTSAWRTGDPGMFFHDAVNRTNFNKHLGLIYAPNPCGETPNRNNEPCNLGSIVLWRFFRKATRDIDFDWLWDVAYRSTYFLDDILDANVFPHPAITEASLLTRKLGLGVMGWAELLALMNIHYDTQEAVDIGDEVMTCLENASLQASTDMAKKKGPYKGYSDRTEGPCVRNETRTSIAPTGTIYIIADAKTSSIEPHFALDLERTTNEGIKMREQAQLDRYDGFKPKVANEIGLEWHIRHQAAFQKHTDLGVSKTINLPNSASVEDISKAYRMMWETGCKGGTVYRDGCRSEQVLVSKDSKSKYFIGVGGRRKMPVTADAKRHKFMVGQCEGYIHPGFFDDGTLGEIFITMTKHGSTINGILDAWAISFSTALQWGAPLSDLCKKHAGTRFEPAGLTDDKELPVATSIIDYVVRWLEMKFLNKPENGLKKEANKLKNKLADGFKSGHLCPDCGGETIFQAGCLTCPKDGCGWTRCG